MFTPNLFIFQSLNHPNIVEIKAIVTDPSTMLVMEFIPMGSLLTYLRMERESIKDLQLIKFATDIAEVIWKKICHLLKWLY